MSGDLIWVLGDPDECGDRRYQQVRDLPDQCGNGHATVFLQDSWCPDCGRESLVFRCRSSCHWVVAVPAHYESGHCDPSKATGTDRIRARGYT